MEESNVDFIKLNVKTSFLAGLIAFCKERTIIFF